MYAIQVDELLPGMHVLRHADPRLDAHGDVSGQVLRVRRVAGGRVWIDRVGAPSYPLHHTHSVIVDGQVVI
jgi:hypothetical protein